jgi:hypothetical protein
VSGSVEFMTPVQTLGSQRAVNVKYYLTTDGPTKIDASRIEPRQGITKGKVTHFYFLAEGSFCPGQVVEGAPVDESAVQGRSPRCGRAWEESEEGHQAGVP